MYPDTKPARRRAGVTWNGPWTGGRCEIESRDDMGERLRALAVVVEVRAHDQPVVEREQTADLGRARPDRVQPSLEHVGERLQQARRVEAVARDAAADLRNRDFGHALVPVVTHEEERVVGGVIGQRRAAVGRRVLVVRACRQPEGAGIHEVVRRDEARQAGGDGAGRRHEHADTQERRASHRSKHR